ncbi:MAG: hypothetical protein LQ342_001182 [Letrouitia transgressa]|nr:MAG: hypothetical protein LQ342_001182 [Letrouitia transgressa]
MDSFESTTPSSLTAFIRSSGQSASNQAHSLPYHALAAQVLHNLQFQHDWTALHIRTKSPISSSLLSRPLVSGLPPHRIYIHPDDQVKMLKNGVDEESLPLEREWVLPTHLKEKWSLRQFADIFDAIDEVPQSSDDDHMSRGNDEGNTEEKAPPSKRTGGKRVLLAIVGDDSTIVYYIMHEGLVKPRQN